MARTMANVGNGLERERERERERWKEGGRVGGREREGVARERTSDTRILLVCFYQVFLFDSVRWR